MKIESNKNQLLIGLISDTHIPSRVPQIPSEILNDFKKRKVDFIFHLGDFTSINVYNHLLKEFGNDKVIAVLGNLDSNELKRILPEKIELELFGKRIFLTHGMGGPNIVIKRLNRYFDLSNYDIIIFGHVHRPYNEYWKDGKLYLNPGTPTDKKFTDINSYAFLKISKNNLDFEIVEI
ncbi:MAG: metallophosphoesterase [Candidatus Lokiarchaeota archaeon]